MNIKAILISFVILVILSGVAYSEDNTPGRITFYTTTEGNYSLIMQYGSTMEGSQ